nr:uncharacterized protein LOC108383502 isoform X2 [Manis javanica]XP_036846944.1 uncharacterized protein LOC108383502 isoform X2 [Manis javanica]XP_036846945.1 uncharacterized protein LOC108383502 isoform X2 [Manis javanica]
MEPAPAAGSATRPAGGDPGHVTGYCPITLWALQPIGVAHSSWPREATPQGCQGSTLYGGGRGCVSRVLEPLEPRADQRGRKVRQSRVRLQTQTAEGSGLWELSSSARARDPHTPAQRRPHVRKDGFRAPLLQPLPCLSREKRGETRNSTGIGILGPVQPNSVFDFQHCQPAGTGRLWRAQESSRSTAFVAVIATMTSQGSSHSGAPLTCCRLQAAPRPDQPQPQIASLLFQDKRRTEEPYLQHT